MAITAKKIVTSANSHLGIVKYSSGHKKIVDTYNSVKPLPVGYAVTYDDDWCDAFVTYLGIINKATDLIGRECGVQRHKRIFQDMGIWKGKIKPKEGDIVHFDWQANGWDDHIGYVKSFDGTYITTVEGNTNNRVGSNRFKWDDWRIVGYARPKYGENTATPSKTNEAVAWEVLAGVWGNGSTRVQNLISAGYDYDAVQTIVNQLSAPVEPITVDDDILLSYNGNSLTEDEVDEILVLAKEYNVNPVFLIVMLHFEGLWGGSAVAKENNNLAGITWSETYKGHPDVAKRKGSARPLSEGGHYVYYQNVQDFLKDWLYLLRPNHFYKVTGKLSFNESIEGLFKIGGAVYDYAASGYEHYLAGMNGRKNAIEKQNPGVLDAIMNEFNGEKAPDLVETPVVSGNKSVEELAKEVIAGKWGMGENRVTGLTTAGYDYEAVQDKVNDLLSPQATKSVEEMAREVIAGKFGVGKDRTEKLRQEGYDAQKVQDRVNELLKSDLTEVARDVIRGQYGDGPARIQNLRAVGYNPTDVQKRVNELM